MNSQTTIAGAGVCDSQQRCKINSVRLTPGASEKFAAAAHRPALRHRFRAETFLKAKPYDHRNSN
jgi:hypothetical protein